MDNKEKTRLLQKAIAELRWIEIDYVDGHMNITTSRIVKPNEIQDFRLIAFDKEKNGFRQFQFDGIQKIVIKEKYDTAK